MYCLKRNKHAGIVYIDLVNINFQVIPMAARNTRMVLCSWQMRTVTYVCVKMVWLSVLTHQVVVKVQVCFYCNMRIVKRWFGWVSQQAMVKGQVYFIVICAICKQVKMEWLSIATQQTVVKVQVYLIVTCAMCKQVKMDWLSIGIAI